jgi:hypothetical protein
LADRGDLVVGLEDDLSVGPINPADPRTRAAWVERELGYEVGEHWIERTEAFWSKALGSAQRRIVWTSRRCAPDYAGFLEWLWRIGDEPCEVLDVSDFSFSRYGLDGKKSSGMIIAAAILDPDEIAAMNLLDLSKPLSPEKRSTYRQAWGQLRAENALGCCWRPDFTPALSRLSTKSCSQKLRRPGARLRVSSVP